MRQHAWRLPSAATAVIVAALALFACGFIGARRVAGADTRPREPLAAPTPADASWSAAFGRPGLDDDVRALADYGGAVVATGIFALSDSIDLARVARWNGDAWEPLGAGLGGETPTGDALVVYHADLLAGGRFSDAGGQPANSIARWDGSGWNALGLGVTHDTGDALLPGFVTAMVVYGDLLVTGGGFDHAGSVAAANVAAWNGTSWSALGNGLVNEVAALAVVGGELYAATALYPVEDTSTAAVWHWDGAAWQNVGPNFEGSVLALGSWQGELVAGGRFSAVGTKPLGGIVRWDGAAWRALSATSEPLDTDFDVRTLAVFGDELVAGGPFVRVGTVGASSVARWNGTTWAPLGAGVSYPLFQATVSALLPHPAGLVVGGMFERAGGGAASHVASWNGTDWSALGAPGLGIDGIVLDTVVHGDSLVVAGTFSQAGGDDAHGVAAWDGDGWSDLGADLPPATQFVAALLEDQGRLYAAAVSGTYLVDAKTTILSREGNGWQPYGTPVDGIVRCMIVDHGTLVIGGGLHQTESSTLGNVARWNGSAWVPLGRGLNDDVQVLITHGGSLYAGGSFHRSGIIVVDCVARWNGTIWSALGSGLTNGDPFGGAVYDLVEYRGGLLAAGAFTGSGSLPLDGVALWDGGAWGALGSGLGTTGPSVGTCAIANGRILFVGGFFVRAGNAPAARIARWDGQDWSALGSGLGDYPNALCMFGGDLFAVGWFGSAGQRYSAAIARWSNPNVPVAVHDFEARVEDARVVLTWHTAGDAARLRLERAPAAAGPYEEIAPEPLVAAADMRFVDARVQTGQEYWYRLLQADVAGARTVLASVSVRVAARPRHTVLLPPIEPATGGPILLRYDIESASATARLAVYDATGREVWSTPCDARVPGSYQRSWSRIDAAGRRVARGVYFVRLQVGAVTSTRKLLLARP